MSPTPAAEQRLAEGREALAAALQGLETAAAPEDAPLDPALLAQALDHYGAAAELADAGQPVLAAEALLGAAEVMLRMPRATPNAQERVAQAEQHARSAVERLDSVRQPALALRGLLLIAEAARLLASRAPEKKEARLRNLTALLESAAYLAHEYGDPLTQARVAAEACRTVSERFLHDRDENLLDAIAHGERALELLRGQPAAAALELPSLLHHLGNCCMKVGGDRVRWLTRGCDWYREGAGLASPLRYPRLHRMLNEHVAMTETVIARQDYTLPEKELVARYGSDIQVALENRDAAAARSGAWGFLAWAWSLPVTPNVHVGEAHKALAKVSIALGDWDGAQQHLYHSVGVLSAILSEGHPWLYLLAEARDLFVEAVRRNGSDRSPEWWLDRATQSLRVADAACARAAALIERDTAAALPELDHALNVFPCHPNARFYRGVVRMMSGDFPGALADFDFNVMLKPKSLHAHVNRANVKLKLGDQDGALADLDAAVDIDPANADVRRMRAGLHAQRGARDHEALDLEAAVRNTPDQGLKSELQRRLDALRSG